MEETHKKILLVEDDPNFGAVLKDYLSINDFEVTLAKNGMEGFEKFKKDNFDLCILDVMMPYKDGYTLAREIREKNKEVPIIFLTAKSMKEDTLKGFEVGADDYISKPFSMEELLARINAVLRRSQEDNEAQNETFFTIGNYTFDYQKRHLTYKGEITKLTSKESDLLRLLCLNENKVLDRTHALKAIWEDDNYFNARSMDVYIAKLRKHLNKDENIEIINVHGKGFRFVVHK